MTTDERSALLTCSLCGRPHTPLTQANFLAFAAARPGHKLATRPEPCAVCLDRQRSERVRRPL